MKTELSHLNKTGSPERVDQQTAWSQMRVLGTQARLDFKTHLNDNKFVYSPLFGLKLKHPDFVT